MVNIGWGVEFFGAIEVFSRETEVFSSKFTDKTNPEI